MVFTQLTDDDKHAFFALLDEYFTSRPHLLGSAAPADARADAAHAVYGAMAANPAATSKLFSAGMRHVGTPSQPSENAPSSHEQTAGRILSAGFRHVASPQAISGARSPSPPPSADSSEFPKPSALRGRVAAAAASFTTPMGMGPPPARAAPPPTPSRSSSTAPPPTPARRPSGTAPPVPSTSPAPSSGRKMPPLLAPGAPPPMPPRRTSSTASEEPTEFTPPPPVRRTSTTSSDERSRGLVQERKFGNVDMSSGKGFYSSLRNGGSKTPGLAPPIPSAFPKQSSQYAPPPTRSSSSSVNEQEEPEQEGDWAEVLYDYNSGEAGDLKIETGEHVLVVERSSEDWWTGESNGKRGLIPASYVKIL